MTRIADNTPVLDDRLAAEFLAHTLTVLPFPLRQDDALLDAWALRFERPEPPRDLDLPLLAPKSYPRPNTDVIDAAIRALIPPPAADHFTGRKAELDQAVMSLLGNRPVVISGSTGSGKTALLRQIAHDGRITKNFRRVWWLDDLDGAGETIGLALNAPGILRASRENQPRLIQDFLKSSGVLLLIDNMTNSNDLDWALALTPTVAVVADDVKDTKATRIGLAGLTADTGVNLLAELSNQPPKQVAPLAILVGNQLRSLRLLAALMVEDGLSSEALLEFLQSLQTEDNPAPDMMAALYQASFEALPEAYQVLCQALAASPRRLIATETILSTYEKALIGQRALTFIERRGFIERVDQAVRVIGHWPDLIPHSKKIDGFTAMSRPGEMLSDEESGSAKARSLHESGLALMEECRDREAEEALTQALALREKEDTDHAIAETLTALGRLAYLQGDDASAIKRLEAAAEKLHSLRDEESMQIIRVALSRAYRRAGRLEAALSVLDEHSPLEDFALVYRAREEWDQAIAVYQKWDDPQACYGLAETHALAGRFVEALKSLSDCADEDFYANWLRGVIYHMQGDAQKAADIYQQLDCPPEWTSVVARALARALATIGEVQQAASIARSAGVAYETELSRPIFARERYGLALYAHLSRMIGKLAEAEAAAQRAVNLLHERPDYQAEAIAYRVLGRIAWQSGKHNAGLKAFDNELTALGKMPRRNEHEVGVALQNFADIQRECGENDRAVANYRRALTHKDPTQDYYSVLLTRLSLRDLLMQIGRGPEALEAGQQAIELLNHRADADLRSLGYTMALHARAQYDLGRGARATQVLSDWISKLSSRVVEGMTHPFWGVQLLSIGLYLRNLPSDLSKIDPDALIDLAKKQVEIGQLNVANSPIVSAARRDLGNVYLRLERWHDAYQVFADMLEQPPQDAPFIMLACYLGAARAALHLEQSNAALHYFDVALNYEPDTHQRGLILRESAEYCRLIHDDEQADTRYSDSLKLLDHEGDAARVSLYVDTLVTLAYTRLRLRRFGEAIDTFEQALAIVEKRPSADPALMASVLIDMASAHHTLGQYRRAAATYRRALQHIDMRHDTQRYIDTLAAMARSNVALEAWQLALEAYHDAVQFEAIKPDQRRELLIEQAAIFTRVDRTDSAIKAYKQALNIDGASALEQATIHRGLGSVYTSLKDHERARPHFEAALNAVQDDQSGLTMRAIGDGYRAQNQPHEAMDIYLQALQNLNRTTYPVEVAATYRALGEIYLGFGQAFEALTNLETALEIERSLPQQDGGRIVNTLQSLAQAHELRGELDRAALRHHEALVYQDARHVPENYVDTLRALGRLYSQMKRYNEAAKAFEEALSTETAQPAPDNLKVDEMTYALADVYYQQGRLEASADLYRRVASVKPAKQSRQAKSPVYQQAAESLKNVEAEIARHLQTLQVAEQSWGLLNRVAQPEVKGLAFVRALQAQTYDALGRWDDSEKALEQMFDLLQERRAEIHKDDPQPDMQALAMLLQGRDCEDDQRPDDARAAYRGALKILDKETKSDPSLVWVVRQKAGRVSRR